MQDDVHGTRLQDASGLAALALHDIVLHCVACPKRALCGSNAGAVHEDRRATVVGLDEAKAPIEAHNGAMERCLAGWGGGHRLATETSMGKLV